MTEIFYPTAFSEWDIEEATAIERVLGGGRFTMGDEVTQFESEFAAFHDRRHAIMVNSGSSANLVAVAALFHKQDAPLKRGDKAVVPALAWATTYAPLVQHGLDLILLDCDGSWNGDLYAKGFDPKNARLVVGCSILGNPADLESQLTAAGVLDAYFVEDNCESLGAVLPGGAMCGTFGDMSTFSFFYSHQVSAIEGGMILTDDDELARLCRMLRAHGWSRDVERPNGFDTEYDFRLFGYNVRPLELHAAIAREQLKKLPAFIERRRANLTLFEHLTIDLPIVHPSWAGEPSPFGLQFMVENAAQRQRLADALRARGIDCRLPTGGSFRLHKYGAPWKDQETPFADQIHWRGMFMGNGPTDLTGPITAAVEVMKEVL